MGNREKDLQVNNLLQIYLYKISQMCLITNTQIKRYPDHGNVFTRKTSENNQNG